MLKAVSVSVPLALVALLMLAASFAGAEMTKAGVVTTLEGNVTVTRVTLAPQPLKFRDDVFVNDKVTTGERSIARMLLGGKAVVTVRERSTLTITEIPGKATIDLELGKVAVAVAKDRMRPGESVEIRAANAVAGIRGTVVVAEVSSSSAQLGGLSSLVGTFWVLRGQIEAFLVNQPGNPVLVGTLQRFRGGDVSVIQPGQMTQILDGLSTGRVSPAAGGDESAKEAGIAAGLALASTLGVLGPAVPPIVPRVYTITVPIRPGNKEINDIAAPQTATLQPVEIPSSITPPVLLPPSSTPPPSTPPPSHHHHGHGDHHNNGRHLGAGVQPPGPPPGIGPRTDPPRGGR